MYNGSISISEKKPRSITIFEESNNPDRCLVFGEIGQFVPVIY
jgi:hypothetical protein